jgi:AcrR family transcriptional regulator
VAETQRLRLLAAAGEVLTEKGYARTTSAAISDRAGVSRSTFYAQFENVDACLVDAHQMAAECVLDLVMATCRAGTRRQDGGYAASSAGAGAIPVAVEAILDFLSCELSLAKLLGAEAAAGVPQIAVARDALASQLAAMVAGDIHPALIDGAVALASERIDVSDPAKLRELGPQLSQILC